jgi:sugar phosphate permease
MLLLWIVGQVDKTHISLIIADKEFLDELGLVGHNAELGGLMTTFFGGYGVGIFLWGFLVDRFGPRRCAMAGTVLWATFLYLSSHVQGINEYFIVRALLGFAEGNLWPVCNKLTNRWFPVYEHSRVQAVWVAGSTLGTAVGVPLVTYVMLANGWRGALVTLALLSMLPMVLFAFVGDSPRQQPRLSGVELREIEDGARIPGTVQPMPFAELLRTAPFWLIVFCQFVSASNIYTMIQWLPSYLTRFLGLPFPRMAVFLTIGYVLASVVTVLVGYAADRTMQRARVAALTCFVYPFLLIPASQFGSPEWIAVALGTLVAQSSSTAALNGALMHTLLQPKAIARGTGIYVGVGNFCSAIGPWLFGVLITATGGQYWAGFIFMAAMSMAAAIAYYRLHLLTIRAPQPTSEAAMAH